MPSHRLLRKDDPPAVRLENAAGRAALLIVCDHASARVPLALGDLGLPAHAFTQHIAIDIGAEAIARSLARRMDAPVVIAGYSRLVVDCNRDPSDPEWIVRTSDGISIPANTDVSADERAARYDEIYAPYHAAIDAEITRLSERGPLPVVFSVHTFTPVFAGFTRPWHAGVLWNRDGRIAEPLIRSLAEGSGLVIGDNEPYSGRTKAHTLDRHAHRTGLAHAAIEVRQDLASDQASAERWAERLACALGPIMARDDTHTRHIY